MLDLVSEALPCALESPTSEAHRLCEVYVLECLYAEPNRLTVGLLDFRRLVARCP